MKSQKLLSLILISLYLSAFTCVREDDEPTAEQTETAETNDAESQEQGFKEGLQADMSYEYESEDSIPDWLRNGETEPRPNDPKGSEYDPNAPVLRNMDRKSLKIVMSQQDFAEQAARNMKANELHSENQTGGEYEFEEFVSFKFFVKVESKSMLDYTATENFQQREVTVNRNAIYMFSNNGKKDYRDDIVSIELDSIYKPNPDRASQYKCCFNVKAISYVALWIGGNGQITQEGYDVEQTGSGYTAIVRCFRINGRTNVWSICHSNIKQLQYFRSQLIIHVIYAQNIVVKHSLFLHESYGYINFSFSKQNQWKGLCAYGKQQSPVDIQSVVKSNQLVTRNMRLGFDWTSSVVTAHWINGEIELRGSFGSMNFDIDEQATSPMQFFANKIKFKGQIEHLIPDVELQEQMEEEFMTGKKIEDNVGKTMEDSMKDNVYYHSLADLRGEMLVYMSTKDGVQAIASFILKTNRPDSSYQGPNLFFNKLNMEEWVHREGWERQEERKLDLDMLYKKYTNLYFKKDVFWYIGSDTVPPCAEGIYRFVFKNPIYMSDSQIAALRQYAFASSNSGSYYNHREVQSLGLRTIFYAEDLCTECVEMAQGDKGRFDFEKSSFESMEGSTLVKRESSSSTKIVGGDPRTWGPSEPELEETQRTGGDPSTWGPSNDVQEAQIMGGDPSTWGPSNDVQEAQIKGGDPSTWGPTETSGTVRAADPQSR